MKYKVVTCSIILLCLLCVVSFAAQSKPLTQVISVSPKPVSSGGPTIVPLITWGADIATTYANGNSDRTAQGSIFSKKGLNLKLVRIDDFRKQVEMYMRGEMPYLRGTMGMINMAAEVISKDPRTKPVVIYQLSWSTGGDCMVVKPGIKKVKDLRGKTIAVQAYGPHIDYLGQLLRDAGLSMKDVNIKWVKDLTGGGDTPVKALYQAGVDATMVIIPDGLALTSNGTVGTGAEGSVKGAKILLSTKTANRIISDVYAVRSDYFEANKPKVQSFVHGLLQAQDKVRELHKKKSSNTAAYSKMIKGAAKILLDSEQATADTEAMLGDCEFVGYSGNEKFFGKAKWSRGFKRLTKEVQTTFKQANLMSKNVPLKDAKWNWDDLKKGVKVGTTESPRFDPSKAAKVVNTMTAGEGELFSFEIYFQPNQNTFSPEMYSKSFQKVLELASTYGGALVVVEGHSDPLGYLKKKKAGEPDVVLNKVKQAAKNLSVSRAMAVRDSVIDYGKNQGVSLDRSQFTTVGRGINTPRSGMCGSDPCAPKTKDAWLSNMRVVFRIIQIEAEESVFTPLN